MSNSIEFLAVLGAVVRLLLPITALALLLRLAGSLLFFRRMEEIWAWLILPDGRRLRVTHWENTLGSARSCDVSLEGQKVSKVHAVLTRFDDGTWQVTDADSKFGVRVGARKVKQAAVKYGQTITLGDVKLKLEPISPDQEVKQAEYRTREGTKLRPWVTLLTLTAFQLCLMTALLANLGESAIFFSSCLLIAMEWILFLFYRIIRRKGFELESIAFFLTSLGQAAIASSAPGEMYKQLLSVALGLVLFLTIGWLLRDYSRAMLTRYAAGVAGIGLLLFTLIFGTEVHGAKNWIFIGGMSLQPSELAKICFVFVGASSLDRLVTRQNLLLFIAYTGLVCVCLALLSDFGTALVFFVAFVVIAFLRSGNFAGLILICAGTGFGGLLAIRFLPYIASRFSAWGHVWEQALAGGYQQTRAMMCIASGGLLGLGAGKGWLKYVAASDTDLIFAFVSEEYGLILAAVMVLYVALLAVFVVRSAPLCRGSFHIICACAAVSIFVTQTILNICGTVDLLPLTGVTFPFVSNGGTSMLASWGLLAFLKAADTRQNASFIQRLPGRDNA